MLKSKKSPDEHIFEFLEVNILQLRIVLGLVTQMSVGQAEPGELPVRSKPELDVGPAQPRGLGHGEGRQGLAQTLGHFLQPSLSGDY